MLQEIGLPFLEYKLKEVDFLNFVDVDSSMV